MPFSTLSLTIFNIRLFNASIRRSSRSISSEPPFAPIASPIVAFISARYVDVSSALNLFKALTIASCRADSLSVGECWQYFFPLSKRLTQRHTIRFCPRLVQVTRLYRLPHSAQIKTSVSAYLEYLPEAVSAIFCDCGDRDFRLLSSSWARLNISLLMIAGWLFSTIYMGASPSFFFLVLEMQSTVTVFWRIRWKHLNMF